MKFRWTDALVSERAVLASIAAFDGELESIETVLASLNEDENELADIDDRINNALARGVGEHIERLSRLNEADATVKAAANWPAQVRAAADNLAAVLPAPTVAEIAIQHDAMQAAIDEFGRAVTSATEALAAATVAAEEALAAQSCLHLWGSAWQRCGPVCTLRRDFGLLRSPVSST